MHAPRRRTGQSARQPALAAHQLRARLRWRRPGGRALRVCIDVHDLTPSRRKPAAPQRRSATCSPTCSQPHDDGPHRRSDGRRGARAGGAVLRRPRRLQGGERPPRPPQRRCLLVRWRGRCRAACAPTTRWAASAATGCLVLASVRGRRPYALALHMLEAVRRSEPRVSWRRRQREHRLRSRRPIHSIRSAAAGRRRRDVCQPSGSARTDVQHGPAPRERRQPCSSSGA